MITKKYRGVVFDFNGTIFWDTKLHNEAWDIFLSDHTISLPDDEKSMRIHGKTNKEILNLLFDTELDEESIRKYSTEKEDIYQEICTKSGLTFAPGAIDFIEFLRHGNIDYALATSSGQKNIDYYISHLKINKLFPEDRIIFNQGSMKSKPDPEIFSIAIRRINKQPEDVIIFEDSYAGIISAEKAGAGKIIIVNSNSDDYSDFGYDVISNFGQVDKSIFTDK